MQDFEFVSEDLGETEAFLTDAYTPMRLERLERHTRTHLSRRSTPGVSIDEVALDFDMHYEADPIGRICLCSVHDGVLSENHQDGRVEHYVPGEIVSLTPPDLPYSGVAREATYSVVMIDPALLLDDRGEQVDLISDRPRDGARLKHTVAWMRDHVLSPGAPASELVLDAATRALAAAVLEAFPHDGEGRGSPVTSRATPATIRRALAFMESEAGSPIGITEISRAARVTPRALQYAFRRHLDCTPLEHLRRLRLEHVRDELSDPDPGTTVTAVASRWGFFHLGHFSAAYRTRFGETPGATLARRLERPPALRDPDAPDSSAG